MGPIVDDLINVTNSHVPFIEPEARRRKGGQRPMTVAERIARFWSRVETTASGNGCWVWTGGRYKTGYGMVALGQRDGKQVNGYAHRIAYQLAHGPIPDGMVVMHSCDNQLCVRHVVLGTQQDNIRDARDKGRLFTGVRQKQTRGRSPLTDSERAQVRALRAAGVTVAEVARRFNLTAGHVISVAKGRRKTVMEQAREYDAGKFGSHV